MANVGLSVFEGVSNGLSPFVLPSKHNIGLLMGRERGIPYAPTQITSLQEDRLYFGGITSNFYGAFVTRNIFKNARRFGALIYGVRMFDQDFLTTPNDFTASGLFTDGAPGTQTLTQTVTVPAAIAVLEKRNIVASNVSEGDIFTITSGASNVAYTALAGDGAEEVHAGLYALIAAQVIAVNLDFTKYTWVLEGSNAYIEVEEKITNTAIVLSTTTTNGVAVTIAEIFAGQKGKKDPGTWGNSLVAKVYPFGHLSGDKNNYMLEVYYKNIVRETFKAKTLPELVEVTNQLSNYVFCEAGVSISTANISDIQTVYLAGGSNGTAITESELTPTENGGILVGFSALDGSDVNLIANTEFHTKTAAITLDDYVTERSGPLGIVSYPYLADLAIVTDFANSLQKDGPSFLAAYNLWCKVTDEAGGSIWVPGLGHVLGAGMIRVPNLNLDLIYTPPAGVESSLVDCIDIFPNFLSPKTIDNYVQQLGCNLAVFKKGKGFFLFSSRTMATNSLYHSIHIRRQTSFYVTALEDNLLFAVQKPNDIALHKDIYAAILSFFKGEYNNGGLERSVPFETACEIINDKTVNPTSQDRKIHNVHINWIPTECTESLVIRLNRNDGALIAESI